MEALRIMLGGETKDKATREAPLSPPELTAEQRAEFGSNEISTQKYSIYSFVGKALMEQFRRVANAYFLILSIAMMIGTYTEGFWTSPVSPWTTFGPLCLVVAISMAKEAFEDYKRYLSDNEINNRLCNVVGAGGEERQVLWKDLRVGMVVRVQNKEEVPADLICLTTSELKAVCYVETSNIDGETNLKLKEAMAASASAAARGADGAGKGAAALAAAGAAKWEAVAQHVGALRGVMQYDGPNDRIHSFTGRLSIAGAPNDEGEAGGFFPVGARNMLLRGCMVRNTKWVCGMVVYTGKDTKVMKKGGGARSKLSQLEKTMNGCILVILGVQFLLAVLNVIAYALWDKHMSGQLPYLLKGSTVFKIPEWLGNYVSFTILFNNFVPISLYVTVEVVNVFQSLYVNLDQAMYDPESNTPARARTSNLNTELGQIEYIFSDKTGTLTRNVMEFKQCSVGGRVFGTFAGAGAPPAAAAAAAASVTDDAVENPAVAGASLAEGGGAASAAAAGRKGKTSGFADAELLRLLTRARLPLGVGAEWQGGAAPAAEHLRAYEAAGARELGAFRPAEVIALEAFFACMAVCHTVVAEEDEAGGPPIFQAESPDEAALALAARDAGFAFMARHADSIVIQRTNGSGTSPDQHFALFGTHEFNSTRKRMSVVVQTPDKRYLLMCKGADNVIFDRAVKEASRAQLVEQLTALATTGLRTLVLAQRELSAAEFASWKAKYVAASVSITDREGMLAAVAEEFETGLHVLGATAIEDRLQDGVPETIADLRRAGIKTWVLTGDKLETAINIGYSCRLLEPGMDILTVDSEDEGALREQVDALHKRFVAEGSAEAAHGHLRALVVTGPALSVVTAMDAGDAEADKDAPSAMQMLLAVGDSCKSVIACRVSPQQKAAIVTMVRKSRTPYPMTLAIGDGANDVGMIQRAEVGVGISGKEGLQAANAADFSIAQFRFLKNLLLIHGRWDYRRMSKVVLYSFYKNVVITLAIFYFSSVASFSGTSLFESIVYSSYNLELALPIIGVGLFDRDLGMKTVLAHPSVYSVGLLGRDINVRVMAKWVVLGIVHSFVCFWIPYGCFSPVESTWSSSHGWGDGHAVYGTTIFCVLWWSMQLEVAQITLTWTYVSHILLWLSIVLWYIIFAIYERGMSWSPEFYGVLSAMLSRGPYYLVVLLTVGAVLLIDLTTELVRTQYFPTENDVQRELDRKLGDASDGKEPKWGDEDESAGATAAAAPAQAPAAAAAAMVGILATAAVVSVVNPASSGLVLRAISVQAREGEAAVRSRAAAGADGVAAFGSAAPASVPAPLTKQLSIRVPLDPPDMLPPAAALPPPAAPLPPPPPPPPAPPPPAAAKAKEDADDVAAAMF